MNAIVESAPTVKATAHPTHKLKLLLKREYWEHRGGFFWGPLVAGIITVLMHLIGLVIAEVLLRQALAGSGSAGGGKFVINGLDLNSISAQMSPAEQQHLVDLLGIGAFSAMFWPMAVLGFVVFFYCLGALYDDRKDRSVLFWKSLPVSDRDTVLSKLLAALVLAPVLATGIAIVAMIAQMLITSVFILIHHGNPLALVWSPRVLLGNVGIVLAALPLYALWALPSAGWLLLCSAWAKTKPFLWAIALPVVAGGVLSWLDYGSSFDLHSKWFWKNVVAHLLGGVFPASWASAMNPAMFRGAAAGEMGYAGILQAMSSVLSSPQLWLGAGVGIAMITAAIRLRRWRDEG
ncbi:MAG: ABC-2 transporter permease [Thermomonas sp.]|uniref:ABC-2 transporter permease n=1 Tax=Thermomonas sp. TaxID=1971895 RepID=UPI001D4AD0C6|nr:ABC-2 transporter permease [Thermomonas sp.]MBZ0088037.1 ABC-2 transporter permease [Thermomonas sp.]MCO5055882.1 ABC-2 transporter permease [Thermomonas sp.]